MEIKVCPRCGPQPVVNFNIKNKLTGRLQPLCKSCQNANTRRWYAANKQQQLQNVYRRRRRYKAEVDDLIFSYLSTHPCIDCGETDIVVLDFDHVRGKKMFNIAQIAGRGFTLKKIAEEIAKCEVRCANCHRRITAKRAGHSRWIWSCARQDSNLQPLP